MGGLPTLIFLVDVQREYTAIHEANILNIPIIAMVDTNGDPDVVDYVIPANDDAIRAIKLVTSLMTDAVLEGSRKRKDVDEEQMTLEAVDEYDYRADAEEAPEADDAFLGEATLAKLRSGSLHFESEGGEAETEAKPKAEEEAVAKVDTEEASE
jgi:small subunit ribosomal protein S2